MCDDGDGLLNKSRLLDGNCKDCRSRPKAAALAAIRAGGDARDQEHEGADEGGDDDHGGRRGVGTAGDTLLIHLGLQFGRDRDARGIGFLLHLCLGNTFSNKKFDNHGSHRGTLVVYPENKIWTAPNT